MLDNRPGPNFTSNIPTALNLETVPDVLQLVSVSQRVDAILQATETMPTNTEDIVQKAAQAKSFTHDGFIFLGIGIAVTLLRTYARWDQAGFKRFQADDFLVWLALVSWMPNKNKVFARMHRRRN